MLQQQGKGAYRLHWEVEGVVLEGFLEEVRLNQKSEGSQKVCPFRFPLVSERFCSNQDSSLPQGGESKHPSYAQSPVTFQRG